MSPTLEELRQEEVWRAEFVSNALKDLVRKLRERYSWGPDVIGTIGDARHLSGYHRSRAWVKESVYCKDRFYSVTETEGNRTGGDDHVISAMDIITPSDSASLIASRLRRAKARGELPMVRQIILESSPSHVHISIDRGMVQQDLTPLYNAITGDSHGGQTMVTVHCEMPELRQGATGSDVSTAQALANLRGATLSVDGNFGPKTDAAIRDIQTRYAAESVDGVIGPETWTILLSAKDQD